MSNAEEMEIRRVLKVGRMQIKIETLQFLFDPELCPDNFYKYDTTRSPANLP